jgi:hypothetical protein
MEHFNLSKDDCITKAVELMRIPHTKMLFVADNVKDTFTIRNEIAEHFQDSDSDLRIVRIATGQIVLSNSSCVLLSAPTATAGRGMSLNVLFSPAKCFENEDFVAGVIPALYSHDGQIYKY